MDVKNEENNYSVLAGGPFPLPPFRPLHFTLLVFSSPSHLNANNTTYTNNHFDAAHFDATLICEKKMSITLKVLGQSKKFLYRVWFYKSNLLNFEMFFFFTNKYNQKYLFNTNN